MRKNKLIFAGVMGVLISFGMKNFVCAENLQNEEIQKTSDQTVENVETSEYETETQNQGTAHWFYDNAWYYCNEYGEIVTGRQTINGVDYIFNDYGVMQTGWILCDEGWYYAEDDGALCSGWRLINNNWYYFDFENEEYSGLMSFDCEMQINGVEYAFRKSGEMKTGWQYDENACWKYYNSSGAKAKGWNLINNVWYYMDPENDGIIITKDNRKINGNFYFFEESGAMQTGWIHSSEGWYLTDQDGAAQTGWQYVNGNWYYLDDENYILEESNWRKINGDWYYFRSGGYMQTQWAKIGNYWYYFSTDGAMKTGWQYINSTWYYMYCIADENNISGDPEGSMATGIELDGWIIGEDGCAHEYLDSSELLKKIEKIKEYVDTPYLYGGSDTKGWDCSGFTSWALKYLGKEIPRTAAQQAQGGKVVDADDMDSWEPGDILVYKTGSSVTHVALYLGDGKLMHALNSKYGTLIQGVKYYEKWDSSNYLAAVRRYL